MHVRFPSETTIPCWDSKASIWTISHLQNMKAHLDHQSFLRWNKPNLFKPTTHSYYWFIVYILCLYHSPFHGWTMLNPRFFEVKTRRNSSSRSVKVDSTTWLIVTHHDTSWYIIGCTIGCTIGPLVVRLYHWLYHWLSFFFPLNFQPKPAPDPSLSQLVFANAHPHRLGWSGGPWPLLVHHGAKQQGPAVEGIDGWSPGGESCWFSVCFVEIFIWVFVDLSKNHARKRDSFCEFPFCWSPWGKTEQLQIGFAFPLLDSCG